ncbi:phage tail protein [Campylobacter lanienae]|uniref:phage tail protein n=1 Tax=Campylobacter lanienae TaxID=75658 RepID=UPI000BB4416A|nr:phage tail protein [Campylobacter lanienae]
MAEYYTILTNTGIAKFVAARASGNGVNLTKFKLSKNEMIPTEQMESLDGVVYEANINSKSVDSNNPNYVNIMCHVPSSVGGFEINAIGIYDEAGSLLAVGNLPKTYKPNLDQGSAKELMIKVVMELSNADEVILKLDPSVVMATRSYVDETQTTLDLKSQKLKEELTNLINLKLPIATYNTDKAAFATKNELGLKADKSTTYTKTQTDNLLNNKENAGVAKSLVDSLRNSLQSQNLTASGEVLVRYHNSYFKDVSGNLTITQNGKVVAQVKTVYTYSCNNNNN